MELVLNLLPPYWQGKHLTVIIYYSTLQYLYAMQDTSNMLTRWAMTLQLFDMITGRLNIIPDTLSRLLYPENSEIHVASMLAPICRNVSDNPALHATAQQRPYVVDARNLDKICPVSSHRELFHVDSLFASTTTYFIVRSREARNRPEGRVRTIPNTRGQSDCHVPTQRNRRVDVILLKTRRFTVPLIFAR